VNIVGFIRSGELGILPVPYYRVAMPLEALRQMAGWKTRNYDQTALISAFRLSYKVGRDPDEFVSGFDLYVLSRLYGGEHRDEFFDLIHEKGGLIVFDTDDDLTEEYRNLDGRGEEFIDTIIECDAVTVSTDYLAGQIRKHTNHNPIVLPNHVNFEWFSERSLNTSKKYDGLVIGVLGTETHYKDWEHLVPVFDRLSREYDDVVILSGGYCPEYMEKYEHIPFVPYSQYPCLMRQFDIVCCALEPIDGFNLSKSSVKALESMASARRLSNGAIGGAVAVCTDMPVYQKTVRDKYNGFLVNNDEWYETLKELIENERLRNKVAVSGHRWVRKNRDMAKGYKLWRRAYRDIAGGKHDSKDI